MLHGDAVKATKARKRVGYIGRGPMPTNPKPLLPAEVRTRALGWRTRRDMTFWKCEGSAIFSAQPLHIFSVCEV